MPEAQERAVIEALSPAYRSVLTSLETASGIAAAPAFETAPSIELMREDNGDVLVSHCTSSRAGEGEPLTERSRVTFRISPDGVVHGEGTYRIRSPEEMRAEAARETAHKAAYAKVTSDAGIAASLAEQGIPPAVQAKISSTVSTALRSSISMRIGNERPITEARAKEIQDEVLGRFVASYKAAEEVSQGKPEQEEALKAIVLQRAPSAELIKKLPELAARAPEGLFEAMASGDPDRVAGAVLTFARYLATEAEPAVREVLGMSPMDFGADDQSILTHDILSLVQLRTPSATAQRLTREVEHSTAGGSTPSAFQYMVNLIDMASPRIGAGGDSSLVRYGRILLEGGPTAMADRAGRTIESPVGRVEREFLDKDVDPTTFSVPFQSRLREFIGLEPGAAFPPLSHYRTDSSEGA
jgi:hypothetical protein